MCGRYNLHVEDLEPLVTLFGVERVELSEWQPRYNMAPSQLLPVVTQSPTTRQLSPLRWGLIPHWAPATGPEQGPVNARVESIADKPSFRDSVRQRRCIVPATGYYEWQALPGGRKQPMLIAPKQGGLLGMAGIWDLWHPRGAEPVRSFAIVTTNAEGALASIHPRVPLVLAPALYERWLRGTDEDAASLCQEAIARQDPRQLKAIPISPRVNSPAHDDAACIEPADIASEMPDQLSLFGDG